MFGGLIKRHQSHALRLYYGYECSCPACSLPQEQRVLSAARRQLLNVLTNASQGFQPIDTRIFDHYGTLDGKVAEHPAVLKGISRLALAEPLSSNQKNAYRLFAAGLRVAEGHHSTVLADAYADVAEALLRRMRILDDIVPLQALKSVETWM